jgi:hypothetical protein
MILGIEKDLYFLLKTLTSCLHSNLNQTRYGEGEMLTLTRIDDQKLNIQAAEISRVRQRESIDGAKGHSRVDWVVSDLVYEPAADVAASVKAEIPSFISLMQPGGKPVWFDGAKATGPVFVSEAEKTPDKSGKINSALIIANKKQFTANTPQEVYEAIKAQGGKAIPPFAETIVGEFSEWLKDGSKKNEIWDAELYVPPSM